MCRSCGSSDDRISRADCYLSYRDKTTTKTVPPPLKNGFIFVGMTGGKNEYSAVFLFSPPFSLTKGCVSPLTGGTWNRSISSIILSNGGNETMRRLWRRRQRAGLSVQVCDARRSGSSFSQHDSGSFSSIPTEVTRQQNSSTALLPGLWHIHDWADQSERGSY